MKEIEIAKLITSTVHDVLSKSEKIVDARCLYTTHLILHFFERCEIPCKIWQGSTHWYSKKYVEYIQRGESIEHLFQNENAASKARQIDALKRKGIRTVSCLANQSFGANQLGGHLAILAKIDDKHYLIDPTAYQFKRNQSKHGYTVNAPDVFYFELFSSEYEKPDNLIYTCKDVAARYTQEPLTSLSSIYALSEEGKLASDINPRRYASEFDEIESKIFNILEKLLTKK